MKGTRPAGLEAEREVSAWVRNMFGQVAPRYDFLNHLLSFNIDRYWRARTVKRVRAVLERPEVRVLDLCCGTGDLMLALQDQSRTDVMGTDFCHPMLVAARRKSAGAAPLFEADALQLPLPDSSLDLVTVAFGFRNLANYEKGLAELMRVLRPGGVAAILEFSQPPNRLFASLYNFYSRHILPRLGGAISGSKDAYSYLPESVRKFPGAEVLAQRMSELGFCDVGFERMTFGIVALHLGTRPAQRT
ncbi:MAG: bifunctional demethylmenaquinone methyltransferase/2-methoxy-6-polyprenyl-1,4-benzoquinol methylase UbiE, partial [Bryobacteraceae bacterium]